MKAQTRWTMRALLGLALLVGCAGCTLPLSRTVSTVTNDKGETWERRAGLNLSLVREPLEKEISHMGVDLSLVTWVPESLSFRVPDGEWESYTLRGLNLSGFSYGEGDFSGLQVGGALAQFGEVSGGQLSLANTAGWMAGLQVAPLWNLEAGGLQGVQLALGFNGAGGMAVEPRGLQVALANVSAERLYGAQVGALNVGLGKGAQVGLFNLGFLDGGVQVGLINNLASLRRGMQIGLLNFKEGSWIPFPLIRFSFGDSDEEDRK